MKQTHFANLWWNRQDNDIIEALIAKRFSDCMRGLRRHHGFTQEQMAERCHLSRGTIACIENGTRKPSVKSLSMVCSSMGTFEFQPWLSPACLDALIRIADKIRLYQSAGLVSDPGRIDPELFRALVAMQSPLHERIR